MTYARPASPLPGGAGRPPAPPPRRWPWVVGVSVALVVLVVGGTLWWIQRQVNPSGAPGEEVAVTVSEGMSVGDIGALLADEGVVTSERVFRYYARFRGVDPVQAGEYTLHRPEAMGQVLAILEAGPNPPDVVPLTIPEGLRLDQVADRIGAVEGLSADEALRLARSDAVRSAYEPPDVEDLEGFVFPETYFLDPEDDERAVLARAVATFDEVAAGLDLEGRAAALGITPFQAVIVASLVEREARVPEERPEIAGVIYNRLARDMPLGIDATVQYLLAEQKDRLTQADLDIDSPYNTRRYPGLPPGPIASPGRASLEAALAPASHDFLYYVLADADGHHAFATTLAEHNRNVEAAREKGLL